MPSSVALFGEAQANVWRVVASMSNKDERKDVSVATAFAMEEDDRARYDMPSL